MLTAKWTPSDSLHARSSNDCQPNKKMLPPIQQIQNGIAKLTEAQLQQTSNIFKKLLEGGKHVLEKLPFVNEIQQLVKKLSSGTHSELATVPGLNMFTDKPRFIVGQMIDTGKTGKIFVPGQTVYHENGDSFLPGFVVNTNDGPCLIPGVVIGKQKHSSIFLPGENILIDRETGQFDFVTGHKLVLCKDLIKPEMVKEERFGELKKRLEDSVENYELVNDIAKMIGVKYDFEDNDLDNLSKLIILITHYAESLTEKTLVEADQRWNHVLTEEERKHCDILKNALFTAIGIVQDYPHHSPELIYNGLTEIFANINDKNAVLNDLCQFLNETKCDLVFNEIIEQNNHKLPNIPKVDILKSALSPNVTEQQIIEKLSTVIEEDLLAPAFQNVSKDNTEFLQKVLATLLTKQDELTSEQNAYEILQVAIVDAIKDTSEQRLSKFLNNEGDQAITELLQEAIGLAVALGMQETAETLIQVSANPQSIHLIASDPLTLEILKRLTVMRQIAEKQPQLHGALLELKRNPHNARTNPKLRELVRESAVLMVPDVPHLKSSEHIPTRLFQEHNTLAMEDFVTRNRQPGTLMIIKRGLQAVVPKEASRAVLNGQVAYTLIDETGIRHFKPMDVFSALRLSKPTMRRFSGYECLGACERNKQLSNADKVKDFKNRLLACF